MRCRWKQTAESEPCSPAMAGCYCTIRIRFFVFSTIPIHCVKSDCVLFGVTSFLAAQAHHLLRRAQQLREQLQDTPPESCTSSPWCKKTDHQHQSRRIMQFHHVSSRFITFLSLYVCIELPWMQDTRTPGTRQMQGIRAHRHAKVQLPNWLHQPWSLVSKIQQHSPELWDRTVYEHLWATSTSALSVLFIEALFNNHKNSQKCLPSCDSGTNYKWHSVSCCVRWQRQWQTRDLTRSFSERLSRGCQKGIVESLQSSFEVLNCWLAVIHSSLSTLSDLCSRCVYLVALHSSIYPPILTTWYSCSGKEQSHGIGFRFFNWSCETLLQWKLVAKQSMAGHGK